MKRGLKLGFGIALCVVGFFTTIFGVAILTLVGPDGRFDFETRATSSGYALVFDGISLRADLPRSGSLAATVDIDVRSSDGAVFVGVGPTPEVDRYLEGVAVDRVVQVNWPGNVRSDPVEGTRAPTPPGDEDFWVASDEGADASLDWIVQQGSWTVVIMNADASRAVDVTGDVAVTIPILGTVGIALLLVGLIMVVAGVVLTIAGAKMPKQPTAATPPAPEGQTPSGAPPRPDAT